MHKKLYTPQSAVVAMFILGNAIVCLPTLNTPKGSVIAFICAAVSGFLIFAGVAVLLKKATLKSRTLKAVLYLVSSVAVCFVAAYTFKDFTDFTSRFMMPRASYAVITAVFAAVTIFAGIFCGDSLSKLSLICFAIITGVIILLFVTSVSNFDTTDTDFYKLAKADKFLDSYFKYLFYVFMPSIVAVLYHKTSDGIMPVHQNLGGYALGTTGLILGLLNAVLVLGSRSVASTRYSYFEAVSTVSVGHLFSRLDGMLYFTFFATCLIKTSVCIHIVKHLLISLSKLGRR